MWLEQTGKLGQVQVVGFDVLPETLAGVEAGNIFATMRQARYDIGYDTVRALADSPSGDSRATAAQTPMRSMAVRAVTKENVAEVRREFSTARAVASVAE